MALKSFAEFFIPLQTDFAALKTGGMIASTPILRPPPGRAHSGIGRNRHDELQEE